MTLLELIQQVCDQIGLDRPSAVVGSSNKVVRQLLGSLYEAADEMLRLTQWPQLKTEGTITLVDAQVSYDLPSDFDRAINCTFWNQAEDQQVLGPLSDSEWFELTEGITAGTLYQQYRFAGDSIQIFPTPTAAEAGDTIVFGYHSKNWNASAAGVGQATFADDTDVMLLPEHVLKLGTKYFFRYNNGLPYAETKQVFYDALYDAAGHRTTGQILSITPPQGARRIANFPDSVPE